jgi:hypothetical protein
VAAARRQRLERGRDLDGVAQVGLLHDDQQQVAERARQVGEGLGLDLVLRDFGQDLGHDVVQRARVLAVNLLGERLDLLRRQVEEVARAGILDVQHGHELVPVVGAVARAAVLRAPAVVLGPGHAGGLVDGFILVHLRERQLELGTRLLAELLQVDVLLQLVERPAGVGDLRELLLPEQRHQVVLERDCSIACAITRGSLELARRPGPR